MSNRRTKARRHPHDEKARCLACGKPSMFDTCSACQRWLERAARDRQAADRQGDSVRQPAVPYRIELDPTTELVYGPAYDPATAPFPEAVVAPEAPRPVPPPPDTRGGWFKTSSARRNRPSVFYIVASTVAAVLPIQRVTA